MDVVRLLGMTRYVPLKLIAFTVVLTMTAVACDSSGEVELTTSSSIVAGTATAPDVDSTDDGNGTSTSTPRVGETVASHEVVLRDSTDDGEVLYIVIPPGSYTDVDLENFVGNLIENDEDISSLEIFDDADAVTAFLLVESDQTAADLAFIDEHHLVTLVERNRIIFQGPYADLGEIAIGS